MRSRNALFLLMLTILVSHMVSAQDQAQPSVGRGWKAWWTQPQSGPAILHVSAHCELPTPGHKVELVPASPQGSDATVLVLNETVHPPEGMVAQVITPFQLHYRKRTRPEFKEVVINPAGTHVPIAEAQKKSKENTGEPK